jgi:hypothetical protein
VSGRDAATEMTMVGEVGQDIAQECCLHGGGVGEADPSLQPGSHRQRLDAETS